MQIRGVSIALREKRFLNILYGKSLGNAEKGLLEIIRLANKLIEGQLKSQERFYFS